MESNVQKLIDVILKIKSLFRDIDLNNDTPENEAYKLADSALDLPLRNCDVGTAEEQTKRFSDFCAAHRHTDLPRCGGCPLENTAPDTGCSFAWAQMPYEAEQKGEGK